MKITIARIRSNVKYTGPLETVLDSFFENYVKWMKANPQHEYDTYNVSFTDDRPKRTPETIDWADVIVIPSDSEFRYHGELQIDPRDLEKSENHINVIRPFFENKIVIVWRSDRGDTEELYRNEVFKNINLKSLTMIDEVDFSGNIHGMKYHFIERLLKNPISDLLSEKNTDFGYWGKMKHGNDRSKTIRQIWRSELSTMFIGGFPSGVQRQAPWIKSWYKLYGLIESTRCTLCFNWLDNTATTSRYPEALAVGIIPFVWRDYDINNTYNIDSWQRVNTVEELVEKALMLRDEKFRTEKLGQYRKNYKEVLLSEEEYYKQFSNMMNNGLERGLLSCSSCVPNNA